MSSYDCIAVDTDYVEVDLVNVPNAAMPAVAINVVIEDLDSDAHAVHLNSTQVSALIQDLTNKLIKLRENELSFLLKGRENELEAKS